MEREGKLSVTDIIKPLEIEYCPAVCARAEWHADDMFPNVGRGGQHNCPYHFGVDYFAAILNGEVNCKHLKRKEVAD
jgi:hypothetical protein